MWFEEYITWVHECNEAWKMSKRGTYISEEAEDKESVSTIIFARFIATVNEWTTQWKLNCSAPVQLSNEYSTRNPKIFDVSSSYQEIWEINTSIVLSVLKILGCMDLRIWDEIRWDWIFLVPSHVNFPLYPFLLMA